MAKWADFLISEVCFNNDKSRIEYLKLHEDLGDTVSASYVITSRDEVIRKIENHYSFCTIFKVSSADNWKKGEDVRVVYSNYGKYLRTDMNNTQKDNLGNLPEFVLANK